MKPPRKTFAAQTGAEMIFSTLMFSSVHSTFLVYFKSLPSLPNKSCSYCLTIHLTFLYVALNVLEFCVSSLKLMKTSRRRDTTFLWCLAWLFVSLSVPNWFFDCFSHFCLFRAQTSPIIFFSAKGISFYHTDYIIPQIKLSQAKLI